MPKSSSAKRTPMALSRSIDSSAVSRLPSSVLSVSSSSRRLASKSVSVRMRSTTSTKSERRNCSGETLTATVRPGQSLPSRQARRSIHSPSSMIRPECSAIGMNFDGGISPWIGCVQRASASTPTTVSPLALTIGW